MAAASHRGGRALSNLIGRISLSAARLFQGEPGPLDSESFGAFQLIVHLLHLFDSVIPSDRVGGAEFFAGFDAALVQLFDEAHVAALVAPRFGDFGGLKSHPGQPWPRLTI